MLLQTGLKGELAMSILRVVGLVITALIASSANAADAPRTTTPAPGMLEPVQQSEFEVLASPYLWLISLEGTATIKGQSMKLDVNIFDIIKASDSIFAYQQHTEFRKGDWGGFFDLTFADLTIKQDGLGPIPGGAALQLGMQYLQIEAGGTYTLARWNSASAQDLTTFILEALAGVRYTYQKIDMKLTLGGPQINLSETIAFADPFIGVRARAEMPGGWEMFVRTDFGGFGVGSDFTWNGVALIGKKFKLGNWNLVGLFGYRALYQDYSKGSGANREALDLWVHGPLLAISGKL
jgi:hypothetical protein